MKHSKRTKVILWVLALLLIAAPVVNADSLSQQIQALLRNQSYVVEGTTAQVVPTILYQSKSYIHVRDAAKLFNYNVSWNASTQTVALDSKKDTVYVSTPKLDPGKWDTNNYLRLQKLIDDNGITSPNYNPNKKPYVVFDWDQTSIFNDTMEELFRYQIENLAYKLTPAEFSNAIRIDIPKTDFIKDYNNLEGGVVNIESIGKDLDARYAYLYEHYIGPQGKMTLSEIKATQEFIDFRGKLAYLYEAIGGTFSANVSYPWVLYLFSGMTSQEIHDLTEKSNDLGIASKIETYTLTSSDTLKGMAGQVTGSYKRGLRIQPEMSNLMYALRANGIDIYVCTASLDEVVRVFANYPKYGYNVPMENVVGMRLEKNEKGVYKAEYKKDYPQTQQEGKTKAIQQVLVSKYGYGPIFIASDSQGDYYMSVDFPEIQLVLIVNRVRSLSDKITLLAQKAVDTTGQVDAKYILQGRNENMGQFLPQQSTIRLGKTQAELMRK
jgi:phosphoserine phosphatase